MKRIGKAVRKSALIGAVLALVIGAGVVALVASDRANSQQEGIHRADRLQLATSLATLADGYFLELDGSQATAAGTLPVTGRAAAPALDRALTVLPGRPTALILNAAGSPVVASTGSAALTAAAGTVLAEIGRASRTGAPPISQIVFLDGHPCVAIATGIRSTGATLLVAYDLAALPIAAYVQQLEIGTGAVSYIIDGSGRLVTSPVTAQVGRVASARLRAASTGIASRVVQTAGPYPDVIAETPVGIAGWHLAITQPAPIFYGALWHAGTFFRWAMLGLLLVVASALLILHQRRQSALHAIAAMAVHDSLTGLPNRLAFTRSVEEAMARHRKGDGEVALLFCDLDGFKAVNDRLGHGAGDALLVAVADRLRATVPAGTRSATATLARLGGDEFTVLLQGPGACAAATPLADAITDAMAETFVLGPFEMTVGISVGVAAAHPECDILRDADVAMYRAKAVRKTERLAGSPDVPVTAV